MNAYDGLGYYYDYLGLDRTNFLVQYNSGHLDNYSGLGNPEFNRSALTGPQEINNSSGLVSPTNRWTHFFIYNKTGIGDGILYSNFAGNYPYSGYAIGVTDDHKLYFETYDNTGPIVVVGSHINSNHNAIAVTKDNSSVSFNYFDFNTQEIGAESFAVQDQFVFPSNLSYIGGTESFPSYSQANDFPGLIETYAYMTEAFAQNDLAILFSGFYSYYDLVPGPVTSYSYQEVTGYAQVPYGYSGITGYQTLYGQIGTGTSGVPISGYYTQALSGYISEGYDSVPLTGTFTIYQTGDSTYSIVIDSGFTNSFVLDSVAILTPLDDTTNEIDQVYVAPYTGVSLFNQFADWDNLKKTFELGNVFNPTDVDIYMTGLALANLGYAVTGNVYSSGYQVSGDYFLSNFDVVLNSGITGINRSTTVIYDYIPSGTNQSIATLLPGVPSHFENLYINQDTLVFADGLLLASGIDYVQTNGQFQWYPSTIHALPAQSVGFMTAFTPSEPSSVSSSSTISGYQRGTSRVFLNGTRLTIGEDYIENATLDFLMGRSNLETGLEIFYNNDNDYFES